MGRSFVDELCAELSVPDFLSFLLLESPFSRSLFSIVFSEISVVFRVDRSLDRYFLIDFIVCRLAGMSKSPTLDSALFLERAKQLYKHWVSLLKVDKKSISQFAIN